VSQSSSGSKWAVVVAQFGSIFSLSSMSCWAPDMSAYDVTAAKLVGPCFVLLFSIAWTRLLNDLKPRLQRSTLRLLRWPSSALAVRGCAHARAGLLRPTQAQA
jgi:hypothetical protein